LAAGCRLDGVEGYGDRGGHRDLLEGRAADEPRIGELAQPAHQVVVEPVRVEQHDRLAVQVERGRGPYLEELVQRAEATRQRDERVRAIDHHVLAGAHVAGDDELVRGCVGHLEIHQGLRDHSDRVCAARAGAVGEGAHHADAAAAGDQRVAACGQFPSGTGGEVEPPLLQVARRGAEDADRRHVTASRTRRARRRRSR
jgi:hypothetical protein